MNIYVASFIYIHIFTNGFTLGEKKFELKLNIQILMNFIRSTKTKHKLYTLKFVSLCALLQKPIYMVEHFDY